MQSGHQSATAERDLGCLSRPKEKPRPPEARSLRWIPEALEVSGLTQRQSTWFQRRWQVRLATGRSWGKPDTPGWRERREGPIATIRPLEIPQCSRSVAVVSSGWKHGRHYR